MYQHTDSGISWREDITKRLERFDTKVIDPCKKVIGITEIGEDKNTFRSIILKENWAELKDTFWPIVKHDLRGIDKSDFVIFNYDASIPTIGTIHELVVATFEKKVILLKYDKAQLHLFNPWIATFIKTNHFFYDWDMMFEYLEKVNDGVFDTSLWII